MSTRSYEHVSVDEAAVLEIAENFVDTIKYLDKDLAARRLTYLLNFYSQTDSIIPAMQLFMAKFGSLKYNKTSAD